MRVAFMARVARWYAVAVGWVELDMERVGKEGAESALALSIMR